ncbi:MAG: DinB family protein [Saprospiraceae bacterium]
MELSKTIYSKSEIIQSLQASFDQVTACVTSTPDEIFYNKKDGKWSVAENFSHLIQSTKPLASVLKKNKLFLLAFGVSFSGSDKFETLRSNYLLKLSQGLAPRNGGGFISKNVESTSKEIFLENWNLIGSKFPSRIDQWSENNLDRFKLPHPLLGKLTVREMLFFTVFHNEHHLRTMKLLNESFQKI